MGNNFPESTDMRVFKAMTYSPMAFFPTNFMIQTGRDDEHHHPSSFTPSFHTYQDFQGVSPINDLGKRSMSSYCSGFEGRVEGEGEGNIEDELSDDGMQLLGEKKKRLNMVQVKTLEKSFELGNKLEPDRKMQLARALGLQPRQIGIWFQNRRARWKTKQLEKDYQILKRQFDAIKQENDALQDNNKKLHDEINALKKRQENIETINLKKETDEGSCSNRSSTEQSCDMNLNISRTIAVSHVASMDTAAADHHHDPSTMAAAIINNKPFFNNNNYYYYYSSIINNNNNNNSPPEFLNNFNQKMHMDNVAAVKEESLCSMFGFDQQDHQVNSSSAGFWPWMEHQHYH